MSILCWPCRFRRRAQEHANETNIGIAAKTAFIRSILCRKDTANTFERCTRLKDAGYLTSISKSVSPKAERNSEQKWAILGTCHQDRISTRERRLKRLGWQVYLPSHELNRRLHEAKKNHME